MKTVAKITLLLVISTALYAQSPADNAQALCKIMTESKLSWIDFMQKEVNEKTDLIKKEMKELHKVHTKMIQELAAAENNADIQKIFEKQVANGIKMYEEHIKAWTEWSEQKNSNAKALCEKNKGVFKAFKSSVFPEASDEEPTEPVKMVKAHARSRTSALKNDSSKRK